MKPIIHILLLSSLCISFSGCCKPCEKPNLGEFLLKQATRDIFDLAIENERVFVNQDGSTMLMTYFETLTTTELLNANCDADTRCGICCSDFEAELMYVQFANADNTMRFDLTLRKDFVKHSPLENANEVTDFLSISFNQDLTCEVQDLPMEEFEDTITLNGKTYSNLFSCELEPNQIFPNTNQPTAFYFSKTLGIVGFTFEGGEVWNLD